MTEQTTTKLIKRIKEDLSNLEKILIKKGKTIAKWETFYENSTAGKRILLHKKRITELQGQLHEKNSEIEKLKQGGKNGIKNR